MVLIKGDLMNKCKGCGAIIQYDKPNDFGYSPKKDVDFCQRCFRLNNYGDLTFSAKDKLNSHDILQKVQALDALILWVVDLFDLETALQESINRFLNNSDIIMIATKRDLLPASLGAEKLGRYLKQRLKENDIKVKAIVVIGEHGYDGKEEIMDVLKLYRGKRDVVIIGNTNAGKSTILKNVFAIKDVTISHFPGTTLDLIPINQKDYVLYDTPGFNRNNNTQILMSDNKLKSIVVKNMIKPIVYQLNDDQTLSVGGLIRLDLYGCDNVSVVGYFSDRLLIHRSKTCNADELWQKQYGHMLVPTLNETYNSQKRNLNFIGTKFDIVILGLGWFCVNGHIDKIEYSGDLQIEVLTRKAMI